MEKSKEDETVETKTKKKGFLENFLKWKDPKDRVKIILQIIAIIISIIIMRLSGKISYDGEVSKSISDELIDNFETGFFMSFNNKNAGDKVKFDTWQGTVKGCGIIKDGKKAAKILEGEKCEDDEENLEEIPSQDIIIYKGLSLSASTKGKYYDLLYDGSIVKNGECPDTKQICGYIDTLKNILCLDKSSSCPVSYIKIQETEPTDIQNLHTITGTKTNFYYSNSPYSNPLDIPYIANSFKIADSVICALPNLYYSRISLYYLDKFKSKYSKNCVLRDYSQKVTVDKRRYHAIDEVDNYDLYEENKIIEKIKNSRLMDYGFDLDKYKDNNLTLYVRTHFGFDKECLEKMEFTPDILVYIYGKADNMILYGNTAYISMIAIISISILNCFSFSGYIECLNSLTSFETFIKYSINFGTSLSLFIYSFVFAVKYDDYYEKEMNCSDIITNNNYNIMIYKIRRNGKYIEYISYLYILLFLIIVISIIFTYYHKLSKKGFCSKKAQISISTSIQMAIISTSQKEKKDN